MMSRTLDSWRILPLAMLLLAILGRPAWAERPRVAVLGLEVTGSIDQKSTMIARELTQGLRTRAKAGNGPYALAPNSDRELIDEKVIKLCDNEAEDCMAAIGKDLGADVLIYGRLQKVTDGYQVTLHVVDVKKRSKLKEMEVFVPANANNDGVRASAKTAYTDLTGGAAPGGGRLVITSNVESASLFVDDEGKDALVEGTVTIALPEGRYRVAIEAAGYTRREINVKISNDETTTERIELSKRGVAGGNKGGGGGFWKPAFFVSLGVAAALGGAAYWQWTVATEYGKKTPIGYSNSDCGGDKPANADFDKACSAHRNELILGISGGAVAGFALISGYFAFARASGASETATSSRTPKARALAITPVITPDSAGATLLLHW